MAKIRARDLPRSQTDGTGYFLGHGPGDWKMIDTSWPMDDGCIVIITLWPLVSEQEGT